MFRIVSGTRPAIPTGDKPETNRILIGYESDTNPIRIRYRKKKFEKNA